MASETEIQDFVDRLVAEFSPQRVILFGSHARGDATAQSDVDLLVVMPTKKRTVRQALDIRLRISCPFALDLLVRTPQDFRERLTLQDGFLKSVVSEGKTLYESRRRRVGDVARQFEAAHPICRCVSIPWRIRNQRRSQACRQSGRRRAEPPPAVASRKGSFPMTGRERVLATFEGRRVDSLPLMPITMMFAADQIGVPYGKYAMDHRVLAEGQIRTAEKFDFDHVSCISDPGCEAADCGAAIHYFDDQPPAVDETNSLLADKSVLAKLKVPDPSGGRMLNRVQAAALLHQRVGREKIVEGWIEGPCAEAADLRGINRLMTDFFDDPPFVRDLFEFIVEMELKFARAQFDAGAELMGVGDAAASLVGPQIYDEFVLPYERRLIDGLHAMGAKVRLHICGNIRRILPGVGSLGCEMIDIDSMVPMADARKQTGDRSALAGNIDPVQVLRNGTPEQIAAALAECHRQTGAKYIVGAGCEVPRDTPEANLRAMCDYARANAGL